jgi:hypothetical protein
VIKVKSPVIIIFFVLLFGILLYTFLYVAGTGEELHYPVESEPACEENDTRSCSVGECTGISTCRNGGWGGCKLEMICQPGEKVACTEAGCAQGFKECNSCGTGYGPCR